MTGNGMKERAPLLIAIRYGSLEKAWVEVATRRKPVTCDAMAVPRPVVIVAFADI